MQGVAGGGDPLAVAVAHKPLIRGQTILELGAGVGTAGLAAARAARGKVVVTDINESAPALREAELRNGMVR